MKKNYYKILMSLTALSLLCSCGTRIPANNLILVDISGSNVKNIASSLKEVNTLYMEAFPKDKTTVYFFSSVKFLAYTGNRLSKDRDFLPIIESGYGIASKIKVKEGTSFDICKGLMEAANSDTNIYVLTDGYFEDSKLTKIKLKEKVHVKFMGLNIANNERVLNTFDSPDVVEIDFKDKQ